MGQKAVAHASKGKGPSGGLTDHNERREGYELPKNVDPARAHLNVIDRSYESLGHDLDDRARTVIARERVSRKVQSNAVLFNPMILSGSHEQMMKIMERGELPEWIDDTRKFVEDKYGKENIISFAMHADELTPHIHVCVVPIIKDKNKKGQDVVRLSAKDKFNPEELTKLQTDYAAAMKKWGLERGMNSKLTGAKHQDTKQFYKDLPEKILEKKAEIEELQETVKELKKEVRIDNTWKTVTEVVDGFSKRKENKRKEAEILALDEKVKELSRKNQKLEESLKNSQKKLGEANKTITSLHEKIEQLTRGMNVALSQAMYKAIRLINEKLFHGGYPFRVEGMGNSSDMVIDINRTDGKGLNKGRGLSM